MSFKKDKKDHDKRAEDQNEEQQPVNNEDNGGAENNATNNSQPDEMYQERIDILEKEVQNYKDIMLRKAAEFENYKRRTENDQLNLLTYAAESFIVKLLPVVDDFERSLQHMQNATDIEKLKEGVQMIYDKLKRVLDDQGVKKIECEGKPFDVNFHEAVMQRPDPNVEPHTVLTEVESGYMYKDRVIRHSKVIVSEDESSAN